MKLYKAECLGTEFTLYLMDEYSKMSDAQLDVLAHYLSLDRNPFQENKTRSLLQFLYDNFLITQESLNKYVPFIKIKQSISRHKTKIRGDYKSVDT